MTVNYFFSGNGTDVLCIEKVNRGLFAFERGSKVSEASTLRCTSSCTLLLFISNFWALGYFAVFQSPLYYYLVPDLDMQSKGHAICATLVLQQCLFHAAQTKNPVIVSQGIRGSHLVNIPQNCSLSSLYDHPLLMSLPKQKQDISKQLFWCGFKQRNISIWMAIEP